MILINSQLLFDHPILSTDPQEFLYFDKFLGKENWYKVSKAVKVLRGEWVSQGKHSYWWVPVTKEVEV